MELAKTLNERIEGCLLGAAIGAELGWYRYVCPEPFRQAGPKAKDVYALELKNDTEGRQGPPDAGVFIPGSNRQWGYRSTPIIALAVRPTWRRRGA